jgi:hypothetical protein
MELERKKLEIMDEFMNERENQSLKILN